VSELLQAAFRLHGRREGTPNVPDCPEGWVAVLSPHTGLVLVLGEHNLWSAARSRASVFKGPSLKKAWASVRSVRPGDSWVDVRLISKPVYDSVCIAWALTNVSEH
jgi:hypothetical protein